MSVAQTVASPTAEILVARARAMIPHIAACAAEARLARRVSASIIAQIEDAGLFRILGGAGAAPDIRLFMVPQAEYRIADAWRVSGLCATGTEDILVDNVFVPEHRTRRMIDNFQCVGAGLVVNRSPLYRIPFGQIFFRGVSSPSIGALQTMLDAFVGYAAKAERTGRQVDRRSRRSADLRRNHGGHR